MARWFRDRSHEIGIPSVRLRGLLPDARFVGCRDLDVTGCSNDSRRLEPGQVYVAVADAMHQDEDAPCAVERAIERGAVGVITERDCPEAGTPRVIVPDSRKAHGRLCHALAGDPAGQLDVFAVAGTLGRAVAATFVRSIFEAAGLRCGSVGMRSWSDGLRVYPAGASSPTPDVLAQMLAAMVERSCAAAVVEFPPDSLRIGLDHGLEHLRSAIVTSLEGADDPEARLRLRYGHARLFRAVVPGGVNLINGDDAEADLLSAANIETERIAFRLDGLSDVMGMVSTDSSGGRTLLVRRPGRLLSASLRLPGRTAAQSALAAVALAWSRGIHDHAIIQGLEAIEHVPGQPRRLRGEQAFGVWITTAPDLLELRDSLQTVRESHRGRLTCVVTTPLELLSPDDSIERLLGCLPAERLILAGDGALIGSASDGPDPVPATGAEIRFEPDRKFAIEGALAEAGSDDAVVIVNSGHPSIERLGRRILMQDDAAIASAWLRRSGSAPERDTKRSA